jgi:DnaJ-class molecular chaperone
MSEIELYYDEDKCKNCMGSGHIVKTVATPLEYVLLISHCPICHGTGVKSAVEKMIEEDAMMDALREKGLIE